MARNDTDRIAKRTERQKESPKKRVARRATDRHCTRTRRKLETEQMTQKRRMLDRRKHSCAYHQSPIENVDDTMSSSIKRALKEAKKYLHRTKDAGQKKA